MTNSQSNSQLGYRPLLTDSREPVVAPTNVVDEKGRKKTIHIPVERPLTIYINKYELVTLMTLGSEPEALVLGYLRNQRIIDKIEQVKSVQVDWDVNSAAVVLNNLDIQDILKKVEKKTVTTGCGQGTIFGDIEHNLHTINLNKSAKLKYSTLVKINEIMRKHDSVYKLAGSVHGCAVFKDEHMIYFVEDVGRHNAVDSIAGMMWLDKQSGNDMIFYTTGRLTSEMVIKGAQMRIPFLLSRSGVTQMGVEMANKVNLSLFGRCSGKHFFLYSGFERFLPKI